MANFQISSDMNVYYGSNDYDSVKDRVIQMGRFRSYVSSRMEEWFIVPERTSVWIDIDRLGHISIGGKYSFNTHDLDRMNRILLSVMEAGGRHSGLATYGDIHFFEDQEGWKVRK